jgi:ribosome-binding factor A
VKPYLRKERVGGQIQKALSEILQKEIRDPRLKMILITGVTMSTDLRHARVYFTSTAKKIGQKEVTEGFASARGYVKRVLAGKLGLRYMPDLSFCYDPSYDYAENIENLIRSINSGNGTDPGAVEKE